MGNQAALASDETFAFRSSAVARRRVIAFFTDWFSLALFVTAGMRVTIPRAWNRQVHADPRDVPVDERLDVALDLRVTARSPNVPPRCVRATKALSWALVAPHT